VPVAKASSFNQFFPWREGYYLAFNAQSGAMAMMTADNYATYRKLTEENAGNGAGDLTAGEQELLRQLEYGRFVHPGDHAEYEWLKFGHRKARFDPSSLGLIIAPTMACNMACKYCFEDNKRGRMSPTVVESIITFIEERAPGLKELQVTWYGGEPLLALDIIDDLTQSILDLAQQYRFPYAFSMISNGTLLTRENTDRLAALGVSRIQVTIDGPARIHDDRRPLKNGQASFETILANLCYASSRIPVSVRINIDRNFPAELITELLAQLQAIGLEDKVSVFLGLLEPATAACANIAENCYDMTEFSPVELEYYRLLSDAGFAIEKLPSPILTCCYAQLAHSFLVDPDGDLYRCFNFAGDKSRSIGNIRNPIDYQHPEFTRLFQFDPFEDSDCRQCNILPICMGGCPAKRHDRNLPRNQVCDSWKYNLQPMLELIARSRAKPQPQPVTQPNQERG
jgi:uncharacterized protein